MVRESRLGGLMLPNSAVSLGILSETCGGDPSICSRFQKFMLPTLCKKSVCRNAKFEFLRNSECFGHYVVL